MHVKRTVILIDRLGPAVLSTLQMKEQLMHRLRAHLKDTRLRFRMILSLRGDFSFHCKVFYIFLKHDI